MTTKKVEKQRLKVLRDKNELEAATAKYMRRVAKYKAACLMANVKPDLPWIHSIESVTLITPKEAT